MLIFSIIAMFPIFTQCVWFAEFKKNKHFKEQGDWEIVSKYSICDTENNN